MKLNNVNNYEVEKNIIANFLLNDKIRYEIINKLKPDVFIDTLNRSIFKTMLEFFNQNNSIDYHMFLDYIKNINFFNTKEIINRMEEIVAIYSPISSLDTYIDTLYKFYKRDQLKKLLSQTLDDFDEIFEPNNVDLSLEKFDSKLQAIIDSEIRTKIKHISNYIDEFNEKNKIILENKGKLTGTDTGFVSLNKILNGFQPGELIILAARPSIGKTALAINFALNAALAETSKNKVAAIFSLEMTGEQLTQRLISASTRICYRDFQENRLDSTQNYSWDRKQKDLKNSEIYIDDSMDSTIFDIRATLSEIAKNKEISIAIVDYLQLIQTNDKHLNRNQEVGKISRTLKTIAKELKIPVLAVAQLSRNIEQRSAEDKKPKLSDLRESGSIEQDADVVMFLDYDRTQVDQQNSSENNIKFRSNVVADLIIAKNRNGETGTIKLNFDKSTGRYDDYSNN